jgi:hypothetical protein
MQTSSYHRRSERNQRQIHRASHVNNSMPKIAKSNNLKLISDLLVYDIISKALDTSMICTLQMEKNKESLRNFIINSNSIIRKSPMSNRNKLNIINKAMDMYSEAFSGNNQAAESSETQDCNK